MTEIRCSETTNPRTGKKARCHYPNKLEANGIQSQRTEGRYKFRCAVCNLWSREYCFMRCPNCQAWVITNSMLRHRCNNQRGEAAPAHNTVSPTSSPSSSTNAHIMPQFPLQPIYVMVSPPSAPGTFDVPAQVQQPPMDDDAFFPDPWSGHTSPPQVTNDEDEQHFHDEMLTDESLLSSFDEGEQEILDEMLTDESLLSSFDEGAVGDADEDGTVDMSPPEREQRADDVPILPWLVRNRFFWKDLGVRLELCLTLNESTKAELSNVLRPYYDYVRVELPRHDWIVHEFYHAPLQEVFVDQKDLLTLRFLPFNPEEVFFSKIPELGAEEISGTAHFVLTNNGQNHAPIIGQLQTKKKITFYRHLEDEDRERLLAVVANITGQMAASYRKLSSSSSTYSSPFASKKRRHEDTNNDDRSSTSLFVACLRNERALAKLVNKFVSFVEPSHETLLRLEDMALEANCFYLLHVLVERRVGDAVRSTIGLCTNDHVSDTVLDFLGCDFAAAKAWAVYMIQTAYRDFALRAMSQRSSTTMVSSPETIERPRRSSESAAALTAKSDRIKIDEEVPDTDKPPVGSCLQVPRRRSAVPNPNYHRELSIVEKDRHEKSIKFALCRQQSQHESFLGKSGTIQLSTADLNEKYGPHAERCVREWIEKITHREFTRPFMQEMRDGEILCDLVRMIKLDVFDDVIASLETREARIDTFLSVLQNKFVLSPDSLFDPRVDLHDECNSAAVVHCIYELARKTKQIRCDLPDLEEVAINNAVLPVIVADDDDDDDQAQQCGQSWSKRLMTTFFGTSKKSKEAKDPHHEPRLKLQNTNVSVVPIKSDEEQLSEPVPGCLIVWTASDLQYRADERQLCSILSDKGKCFELVYLDITPERKMHLNCIRSTPQLPVLTAGANYIGSCKDVVRLESNQKLDEYICLAPPGKGYWVMSEADRWRTIGAPTTT